MKAAPQILQNNDVSYVGKISGSYGKNKTPVILWRTSQIILKWSFQARARMGQGTDEDLKTNIYFSFTKEAH